MDEAKAIDEAVGDFGRNDFAAQLMIFDGAGVSFDHRFRECGQQIARHCRILRDVAVFDGILQREFGGCEQHGQFGPRQAKSVLRTADEDVVGGQPFDHAVELLCTLERLDQADVRRHGISPAALRYRQRERLQAVILKHQRRHGIGHPSEQHIAFRHGQRARRDFGIKCDLDIDLMVRTIDAGRIIDEIGVDTPATQAKGYARGLRDA